MGNQQTNRIRALKEHKATSDLTSSFLYLLLRWWWKGRCFFHASHLMPLSLL